MFSSATLFLSILVVEQVLFFFRDREGGGVVDS